MIKLNFVAIIISLKIKRCKLYISRVYGGIIMNYLKKRLSNKDFIFEWVFIVILCIGIAYYYKNRHSYIVISGIIIVILLNILNYYKKENKSIYCNRKAVFTFFFVYIITFYQSELFSKLTTFYQSKLFFKLTTLQSTLLKVIFAQLIIVILPILTCYFFKIRLKNFSWKCSFKWLLITLLIFNIIFLPQLYYDGLWILKYKNFSNVTDYMIDVVNTLIFNAGCEELVFRGFGFAAIKSFELSDVKANIIQSILFGLTHLYGVQSISGICWHILLGYIFGKIYLNSKSLTPGITLHLLVNSV